MIFKCTRRQQICVIKLGFLISLITNCTIVGYLLFYAGYFDGNRNTLLDETDELVDLERPKRCVKCFKHKFRYLIKNQDLCTKNPKVDLLFLIFSESTHRKERDLIRKTWVTLMKDDNYVVKYAFLLGASQTKIDHQTLLTENGRYGDIIQENFVDSFRNLTLKTVMAFKWASTMCSQAQFVFKADDDMFVNVKRVLNHTLKKYGPILQKGIGGKCWKDSKPIRHKSSKYYIPYTFYRKSTYPEFCSGTSYIGSMTVIKEIYRVSQNIPYFPLEDVYVGMCLKALGLKTYTISGFHISSVHINPCDYFTKYVLTSHKNSPAEINNFWNYKCEGNNFLLNDNFNGTKLKPKPNVVVF